MSFNIRYDTPVDGVHQWIHRRDMVSQIVTGCDIFSLQEPLHHQLAYVKERLGNAFNYVSWGRDDGQQRGEATPIFYRADLFTQEDCGVFWLSETPYRAGSRAWGAPLPRICSWAKLRSKTKNASPFFVFNTHLDYESTKARKLGLYLILSKMRAISRGLPCILTGDFNSTPSEGLIAEVTNENSAQKWGLSLVNVGADSKQATFTGFENNGAHLLLIDYVLVTKGVSVVDYKVLENGVPGRPASDHCPIVANLVIERSSS
jgi:endonuclease/exonuclease/phosphatase family metal-dependent hydrolase